MRERKRNLDARDESQVYAASDFCERFADKSLKPSVARARTVVSTRRTVVCGVASIRTEEMHAPWVNARADKRGPVNDYYS